MNLEILDNFVSGAGSNGNNSGQVSFQKTTPVLGTIWKLSPSVNLYANYGKGFETPTFVETAYATTGANSTPNLGLKPSQSKNFEVGVKAFVTDDTRLNLTLFKTLTDSEIVVQDTQAGRSSYTNAGKTSRDGVELSVDSQLANNFSIYGAYTLLNAKFDSSYTNALGNTIKAGNFIPGTYRTQAYGEIAWKNQATGFRTAFEARHNSKSYVNDVNEDTAPAYTIFNVRAGFEQKLQAWRLSEYVRI